MRCCVPFCKNTFENVSAESKGISFHTFPSEVCLRAAWLRALGKQDSHLPDSAVVCSQHFLNDDIYETENGLRQIRTGATPSTVQVCMICLDTDSKLFLMNKHKLAEAYEQLTGHALYDPGNLKQTVCVQCAQRLINFSEFRDKSLRARALMMDLVKKHEIITTKHVKMINRTTNNLKSTIVVKTLGPDPCDLYILQHASDDKQTDSEATVYSVVLKNEECCDSVLLAENVANEAGNTDNDEFVADSDEYEYETQDPLKYESVPFQCTLCFEGFVYENAYMQHMIMHIQNGAGDDECTASQECEPHTAVSSDSSLLAENRHAIQKTRDDNHPSVDSAQTAVVPLSEGLTTGNENKPRAEEADIAQRSAELFKINNSELHKQSLHTSSRANIDRLTNCVVKLYDVFGKSKKGVPILDLSSHSLVKTQEVINSCDNQCHIYNEDIELVADKVNANSRNVSITLQSKTNCSNNEVNKGGSFIGNNWFTCDVCKKMFERKILLVNHLKTHTEVKVFTREYYQDKLENKNDLTTHMRSHTGEKPYSCKLCKYKSAYKCSLVRHMKTHTGEKPFICKLCNYKFAHNFHLVSHMRTHTGEKPYACKLCSCKFAQNSHLVHHMKTHTGEKPFICKLCNSKFALNSYLVNHMRIHTGEKPFICKLCNGKFARNTNLVRHMKTHTGEKPYTCKLCKFKSTDKGNLVRHMKTHTGEKPFICKLCNWKFARNSNLVRHMKTHTGEKPYACKLCSCKFAQNSHLVSHMRTHIGENSVL